MPADESREPSTLHAVVVYYCNSTGGLDHQSIAYISDVLTHNHAMVYTIIADLMHRIKELSEDIKLVHYFTDECADQNKSYKPLNNLMNHKEDFGVDTKWHYLATSHGKSACDGIGAVIKHQARRASLQRNLRNFLSTPRDFSSFVIENVKGVLSL